MGQVLFLRMVEQEDIAMFGQMEILPLMPLLYRQEIIQ